MTSPQWTFSVGQRPRFQGLNPQLELGDHPVQPLLQDGTVETDAPDMHRWLQVKPGASLDTRPPLVAGIPAGYGQLSVEVRSRFSIPLLLVNGRPVSVGRGRTRIALQPGTHCIEVQSSRTSEPVIVDIGAGEQAEIEYFEDEEGTSAKFGHRPRSYRPIPGPHFQMKSLYVMGMILALPLVVVAFMSSGNEALLMWSVVAAIYVPLLAYVPVRRRFRRKWENAVAQQQRRITRPPRPYPWGETSNNVPAAIGDSPQNRPPAPHVGGALVLKMAVTRERTSKPNNDAGNTHLCSYPTAAPQVFIDGHPQPASWGTWWYPLSAGRHTVRVVVDGLPPGVTIDAAREDHVEDESYEFDIANGETRDVNVSSITHSTLDAATATISFARPRLSLYGDLLDIRAAELNKA